MRAVRNVVIILLLALALTVLPAGGNVAEAVLTMLSILFAVAIGAMLIRFWKSSSLQRDTFTDRQRWLIYGSIGAIALMLVGTDELLSSGVGMIAWMAVMVGAGWLIFNTWREAQSI